MSAWLSILKEKLYMLAIAKLFKNGIGGLKAFIFEKVFNVLWEKLIIPAMLFLKRKYDIQIRKIKNAKQVKAIENAKTEDEAADAFKDLG